jgi:cystathionine beta-lyase/cystathionine gamma-synthase
MGVYQNLRALLGIGDDLIRLSVGVEKGEDLVRALEAAAMEYL